MSVSQSSDLSKSIVKVLDSGGLRYKKRIPSSGICKRKSYSDDLEYIQSCNRIFYRRLNIVLFRISEIQCEKNLFSLFHIKQASKV